MIKIRLFERCNHKSVRSRRCSDFYQIIFSLPPRVSFCRKDKCFPDMLPWEVKRAIKYVCVHVRKRIYEPKTEIVPLRPSLLFLNDAYFQFTHTGRSASPWSRRPIHWWIEKQQFFRNRETSLVKSSQNTVSQWGNNIFPKGGRRQWCLYA